MQLDPAFVRRARTGTPHPGDRRTTVFVRHRWARRYILRMLDDGTLRVTLPRWGSKREAQAFVERSASWIARQQLKRAVAAGGGASRRAGACAAAPPQELPAELLALAAAARHHRDARVDSQSAIALGRLFVARLDHAQLAAGTGAAARCASTS